MAPEGNRKKLVLELKADAVEWYGKIRWGNLSMKEAWTALQTNISAKLKYPLPACTLTKKEYKSIMYPAIEAALPRSGISASIAVEIRDRPGITGGAGALSLYHSMGTSRTSLLVEQLFRGTPLEFYMKVVIEDLVMDAGKYGLLWDTPFPIITKYIDNHSWVFAVLEYNHLHNITITSKHQEIVMQRANDTSIMTAASIYYEKGSILKAINRVRQGHQYYSHSDICTSDGNNIDERYIQKFVCGAIRNNYCWPSKTKISVNDYRVWNKFLKYLCRDITWVLVDPLGEWNLHTTSDWIQNWDWFIYQHNRQLYHEINGKTW